MWTFIWSSTGLCWCWAVRSGGGWQEPRQEAVTHHLHSSYYDISDRQEKQLSSLSPAQQIQDTPANTVQTFNISRTMGSHWILCPCSCLPDFCPISTWIWPFLACSEYFHFFSWIFPVRNLQKLYVLAGCANRHYFCRVRIMLCISPMFWIVTLCVAVCTSVWSGSNLIYENSHNKDQSECRGNLQQFQIKHFKRKSLIRLFSWCEKNQMSRQVTTIQHF